MSWISRDSELQEDDWSLLRFESVKSQVFTIAKKEGITQTPTHVELSSDEEWQQWLDQGHLTQLPGVSNSVNLVMGHEATIPWLEPDRIVMLPFSRPIFSQIVRRFLIHSSVVRAIDRMMSSMFSSMFYDWVHEGSTTSSIVYNCRSAVTWSGGMAMSVTYLPATMTTYAMVYGCDLSRGDNDGGDVSTADIIIEKLSNLDCEVFHPILLPAIYADLERDRHAELVEKTINNPSQRVYDIARRQGCHSDASSSEDSSRRGDESFMVWVKISGLKNSLENWRRQLLKMVDHVDDLERRNYGMEREGHDIAENEKRLRALRESGARIKQRLLDLIDEYDEYIRNCGYTMEGMNIATQLELNNIGRTDAKTNQQISRVNLDVAKMARRDGSLMKSIAMLGMVFLPATFVSAFFSMDFFQWGGGENDHPLSPYLWVYAAAAAALTCVTVGVFYVCILRKRREHDDDEKSIA